MGASSKNKRKLTRNGRMFYWCVKPDDDYMDLTHLFITSSDKKFIISYQLFQRKGIYKCVNPYIVVKGREFKGLNNLGHCWERFVVPEWDDEVITPSVAAQIIDWCFVTEKVTPVDYNGNILEHRQTV